MGVFKRNPMVDPSEIAQSLVSEFVDNTTFDDRPQLGLTPDIEPHYRVKSRLYRIAIILMALISMLDLIRAAPSTQPSDALV